MIPPMLRWITEWRIDRLIDGVWNAGRQHEWDKARKLSHKILSLDPDNQNALDMLVMSERALTDPDFVNTLGPPFTAQVGYVRSVLVTFFWIIYVAVFAIAGFEVHDRLEPRMDVWAVVPEIGVWILGWGMAYNKMWGWLPMVQHVLSWSKVRPRDWVIVVAAVSLLVILFWTTRDAPNPCTEFGDCGRADGP